MIKVLMIDRITTDLIAPLSFETAPRLGEKIIYENATYRVVDIYHKMFNSHVCILMVCKIGEKLFMMQEPDWVTELKKKETRFNA